MDHLMDKELAGWPRPKIYSQWLNVQIEVSYKWCPLGAYTRTRTVQYLY